MKTSEHERVVRSTSHFESLAKDPAYEDEPMMHEHDIPMTGLYWAHTHGEIMTYHKHKMAARRLRDEQGLELPATFWDWEAV